MAQTNFNEKFQRFTRLIGEWSGSHIAFMLAALSVVIWFITGPFFNWSDSWSLVANTYTTLITFCMMFILQNTTNRDTSAILLKLDELILVTREASNSLVGAENLAKEEIDREREEIARLAREQTPK